MRFLVALCCVIEAAAVSFDVTYTIIGATNVPNHDGGIDWLDKSDPYVAIFDNGRQVGRTPTRNNDHNPIWAKRINFKLDSASDEVCVYLFDRDTSDASDAGANLEQMKTQNKWIASSCGYPVRKYGLSRCGSRYNPGPCEDVTRTDQITTFDDSALTIIYDIKIVPILPPPPPPPPSPLPPPPKSPKDFAESAEEMGEKAKETVDAMPAWLVGVLIGVGSVCALGCFCKYCCADDDDDRPSRSSVPAVPVTPTKQASSSSSSASSLHWNQWAAFDRALEKGIVDCLWNPNDLQCVQESMAAAGKGMAAFKDEAISRRIDCIEQSVLGLGKAIQEQIDDPSYRAPAEKDDEIGPFDYLKIVLLGAATTRAVDAILQHPFLSSIFFQALTAMPDFREEIFEELKEEGGAKKYRALLKSMDLLSDPSDRASPAVIEAVRAMCKKSDDRDLPSIVNGLLALSSLYRSRLEQFNGLSSAKKQMSFMRDKLLVCCIPLLGLPQRVLLAMYKLFSALRGSALQEDAEKRESRSEAERRKCKEVFEMIDVNGDKKLSRAEVIKACRTNEGIRTLLGLPAHIRQEDGTRDQFEKVFQQMDQDDSKEVDADEFEDFWFTVILPAHQSNEGKLARAFMSARQDSDSSAEAKAVADRAEAVKASRQAEEASRQAARQEAADRRSSSTQQSPSSCSSPASFAGKRVLLQNLCSRPDLNNKVGQAGEFDEQKGRYVVNVDGETLSLRAENLRMEKDGANAAADQCSHMASAVRSDKYSERMNRARYHNLNSQAPARTDGGAGAPHSNFVGKPLRVRNLNSRKYLNGKIAQATDFDEESGRYVVNIEGKMLSLKPENLELCGATKGAPESGPPRTNPFLDPNAINVEMREM